MNLPEQIHISTSEEIKSYKNRDENLARKWRFPWAGLTPIGGILALSCAVLPLAGPWFLHQNFLDQFWASSFNTRKGQFLGSFVSIVLWDEDHGYPLTYFISIAIALMIFLILSSFFEYFGLMIFREKD